MDARDAAKIKAGQAAFGSLGCTNAHKFHQQGQLGDAPLLTGYGSRPWLVCIISNPGNGQFYGRRTTTLGESSFDCSRTHALIPCVLIKEKLFRSSPPLCFSFHHLGIGKLPTILLSAIGLNSAQVLQKCGWVYVVVWAVKRRY